MDFVVVFTDSSKVAKEHKTSDEGRDGEYILLFEVVHVCFCLLMCCCVQVFAEPLLGVKRRASEISAPNAILVAVEESPAALRARRLAQFLTFTKGAEVQCEKTLKEIFLVDRCVGGAKGCYEMAHARGDHALDKMHARTMALYDRTYNLLTDFETLYRDISVWHCQFEELVKSAEAEAESPVAKK